MATSKTRRTSRSPVRISTSLTPATTECRSCQHPGATSPSSVAEETAAANSIIPNPLPQMPPGICTSSTSATNAFKSSAPRGSSLRPSGLLAQAKDNSKVREASRSTQPATPTSPTLEITALRSGLQAIKLLTTPRRSTTVPQPTPPIQNVGNTPNGQTYPARPSQRHSLKADFQNSQSQQRRTTFGMSQKRPRKPSVRKLVPPLTLTTKRDA